MSARFVVGVDGSSPSRAATSWATRRARALGAELLLVTVVESQLDVLTAEERIARLAEEARRPDLPVETRVLVGSPTRTLGEAVRPGDTLVVGTHKTGFLHGRALGSRSVLIALNATTDVAVVPDLDLRFRRGVVAGVDDAVRGLAVAGVAAREAAERGEELTLVQAVRGAAPPRDQTALGAIAERITEAWPKLVVRSRVSTRVAADALLDAARDKALLVLGTGDSSDSRTFGATLHDVLVNVNAPVLVARGGDLVGADGATSAAALAGGD